ncbi:MAG TPA: VanW family protein [Armatimonadota bacterium]|nr:VanW family protein [Armatimonadota bacterium]HPP74316.1 VanW family protein [Armatimonadota bacterium]
MIRNRRFWSFILAAGLLAVSLVLGVCFSFLASARIAPGVSSAGVALGGLKQEEAAERLKEWSKKRLTETITVSVAGRKWTGVLRDTGVLIDIDKMTSEAYDVGRKNGFLNTVLIGLGLTDKTELPPRYRFDEKKIDSLIKKINAAVAVPAKDATLTFVDGVRQITPQVTGTAVDPVNSYDIICSAIERGELEVSLPIVQDEPEITVADLEPVDTLLVKYSTQYPAWRKERTHNIKLAVAKINGKLLKPGESFSYNEALGPRLKENGYKDAIIYVNGKMVPGTGGGICQVSSTIYNAVLLANLKITERSNHSMPVPYVPLGRDATVAYGLLDLKFENTMSSPIYIGASTKGSRLTVEIYGASKDKKDVKLLVSSPKRWRKNDGRLVTAVTVYRVVRENGVEVSKEQISYDRYLSVPPETPTPAATQRSAAANAVPRT